MQFGNNLQKFSMFGKRRSPLAERIDDSDANPPVKSKSEKLIRQAMLMRDEGKHAKALSLLQLIASDGDRDSKQYAQYELALLHSQLGNQSEADRHLSSLGFVLKLTNSIFTPHVNSQFTDKKKVRSLVSAVKPNKSDPVVTFDDVLPASLLQPLLAAFSSSSVFWSEHEYPTQEFFSYNIRDDDNDSLIRQVADYIKPLLESHFSGMKTAPSSSSVEWWCHRRDKSSAFAHQLHFDLDENALKGHKIKMKRKKVDRKFLSNSRGDKDDSIRDDLHPLVSAVLYLRGRNGAPTLVTDQTLDADSVASQAWLCHPAENRLLAFDGKLLHGVVPFLPMTSPADSASAEDSDCYRITIMMGWWAKNFESASAAPLKSKLKGGPILGPNMAMPSYSTQPQKTAVMKSPKGSPDSVTWPKMLKPVKLASREKADIGTAEQRKNVGLEHIPGPIWIPVASTGNTLPVPQNIPFDKKSRDRNNQPIRTTEMKNKKMKGNASIGDTEFISIAALQALRAAPSIGVSDDDDDEDEKEESTSKTLLSSKKKKSNLMESSVDDHVVEYMSTADLNKLRNGDTSITAAAKCKEHSSLPLENDEIVFVGKWFLKSPTEIRDDVLN